MNEGEGLETICNTVFSRAQFRVAWNDNFVTLEKCKIFQIESYKKSHRTGLIQVSFINSTQDLFEVGEVRDSKRPKAEKSKISCKIYVNYLLT